MVFGLHFRERQERLYGRGGYAYAEPGIYHDVALLDIASMHPSSIVAEELFGERYTRRFREILDARIAIKHGEFERAGAMLDGKLAKYLSDPEQARELIKMGVKVRETKPYRDEDADEFVPEYFVQATVKYRDRSGRPVKYPPKVYLVGSEGQPVLLDEDTIGTLDHIRVKNVDVVLSAFEWDPVNHASSLYVRTMYVEQDLDDDPFAKKYRGANDLDDEMPF